MEFLYQYIILFFVTLVIASLVCIGVWLSSDGETEKDPLGKNRDVYSMILYPLYKLLASPKTVSIKYRETELRTLICDMHKWFPNNKVEYDYNASMGGTISVKDEQKENWYQIANELEEKHNIKIFISENNYLSVWKEYTTVRYWSKPIIACYKCYASFWGSIVYWLVANFALNEELIYEDYSYILWVLYPIFVLALVPINQLLYKLTKD